MNGTTTDFVLDGQSVVREMRTVNGTAAPYATYLQGPQGPMYRRDDTSGSVRWYVYDGLGSVVAEVDPNGSITSTRKYDVYGAVRTTTGTPTGKHGFVGQLGHTSEDETGLEYMRARYYDPVVGRFISEDPGRNGGNWFGYCSEAPTVRVDRSGRFDMPPEADLIIAGALFLLGASLINVSLGGGVSVTLLGPALCAMAAWLEGRPKSPFRTGSGAVAGVPRDQNPQIAAVRAF